MRITKGFLVFMCSVFFLMSCKSIKTVIGSTTADASLSTTSVIAAHTAAFPKFNTLASRALVVYEDGKKEQSIAISLRMEKDRAIWIKAAVLGVTIAKALITPEKVSYYETLGNTYFEGDYSLLSDFLGAELNFDKAQSILLGQSIFDLDKKKYDALVKDNKYYLNPKSMPIDFLHHLVFNPDTYKVHTTTIGQPMDNRNFKVTYGPYQQIEESYYPTLATIVSQEEDKKVVVSIKYRKIDVNASVSFPFKIPEGYQKIELVP